MEGKRFILLLSTAVLGAGLVFPAQDEAEPPAPAAAEAKEAADTDMILLQQAIQIQVAAVEAHQFRAESEALVDQVLLF